MGAAASTTRSTRRRGPADPAAAIIASVSEAVIVTDAARRVTALNPAGARAFGLTEALARGRPLGRLNAELGEWAQRAESADADQPLVFGLDLPPRRSFSATLTPLRSPAGRITGWVVVLQDSELLRQAEQARAEAIQAATHDLRNPINLMNGALSLLDDSLQDAGPAQRECLARLRTGLDRLGDLLDRVLSLDEAAGRPGKAREAVSLGAIARQVVGEMRLLSTEKKIRLEFSGPKAGGQVLAEETWLQRAVSNLVENALKYTPERGRVKVRYHEADGQAICEVSDSGPGISPAAQTRLFERYYRVAGEATRRTPGTGLGLAIVKTIIERHAGRVWVSSREGHGSTFGFAIPLAPAAAAPRLKAARRSR